MNGKIGLDTCFLIDFFKGDVKAIAAFEKYYERCTIHDIIIFEFLCGKLSEKQAALFEEKIDLLENVPMSRKAVSLASQLYRLNKKKGITLGKFDILIASIYMASDIKKILTRNKKHFKDIKGLQVIAY